MPRLFTLALLAIAAAPISGRSEEPANAEKLFHQFDQPVGPFKLKERNGNYVQDRDLLGKIWIAQFFYPGCNLCSRNTPTMQKLQETYRGKPEVRLVSIDLINTK